MLKKNDSKFIGLFISIGLIFTGCTSIQLVSNYDENVDTQTQELQKKMDTYFISMKNLQGAPTTFKENQKFYEGVLADINALESRAAIIYKNELTQQQVQLLKENFAYLVLLHKQCFDNQPVLTDAQKQIVKKEGVDLSMDCNTAYGAPVNLKNRGDKELKKIYIKPIQTSFSSHLGAIMKLELAKKRGDKEDKTS
ncbi:hypothetical protein [Acinetobacter baumannii]|uniref:hypothetical protein n=1 Tax=Acinetobacter baumannii TaxID=470 RepID=UPI001EDC28C9|nr:hypothetical protein [Acinetobacter baumannii]